jgi:DNA-binding ferritin-like protein
MTDPTQRHAEFIKRLEDALTLAEELVDSATRYLIKRALDEA